MITRDNINEVVNSISTKDLNRLKNSNKEYCVLTLHTFNVGSYATIQLTNDYDRYKNVSNRGNVILETSEVLTFLN